MDKEYQRLPKETKNKLINKEKLDIYDNIKNPIYINTYDKKIDKENIEEKSLKDLDNFLKLLELLFVRKMINIQSNILLMIE